MLLDYDDKRLAMSIFALLPATIGVPIYFGHYFPLFRSTQWLRKKGVDFTQEIRLKKAVISLKPCVVVPFSQIAWIFLDPFYGEDSEPIYYGFAEDSRSLITTPPQKKAEALKMRK
ncbi:MAG: hypothetical protein E7541_02790 [Ruminococcaceae bacterium]|nr:hypothetical protein [Oscillospiraceae bacterium]